MATPWPLYKLLHHISKENYDRTFSAYHFWIGLGAAYGGTLNHQLYDDILSSTKPDLIAIHRGKVTSGKVYHFHEFHEHPEQFTGKGHLIHSDVHQLLRFITDAEPHPILSTHAIGLHDRLCSESLEQFFRKSLDYIPGGWTEPTSEQLHQFYTRVNLIAHWVNLGYVKLEDVRDHILQSLVLQPAVFDHHLNSLMILLKISGATFAAYVDPSVMNRCCDLLKPDGLKNRVVLTGLAQVRVLILTIERDYECWDYRRFYNFGKAVGKVFLLLLRSSTAQNHLLSPCTRIPRQLPSQHRWGSQARGNSLSHLLYPRRLLQRVPQARVQVITPTPRKL